MFNSKENPWDEVTTLRTVLDDAFDYADHAEYCSSVKYNNDICDCGFTDWFEYCSKLLGYTNDQAED